MKKRFSLHMIDVPYWWLLILIAYGTSKVISTKVSSFMNFIFESIIITLLYCIGYIIINGIIMFLIRKIKQINFLENKIYFIKKFNLAIVGSTLLWLFGFEMFNIGMKNQLILLFLLNLMIYMIDTIFKNNIKIIRIVWICIMGIIIFFAKPNKVNQNLELQVFTEQNQSKIEYEIIDYKSDKKVNLKKYLNLSKLQELYRNIYWNMKYDESIVRGRIYLNKNQKLPLVLILHGNHSMAVESHLGYEYLAKKLVEEGYQVALVDENYLNASWHHGISKEIDARAYLLHEHIQYLLGKYTQEIQSEQIVLIGHSRGGEAISLAAYKNQKNEYKGKYVYSIKNLIAIAPTYGQYQISDVNWKLDSLNYMLIQGSMDQDVFEYSGRNMLNRINHKTKSNYEISLLIEGANHSQFNTLWGRYDRSSLLAYGLNLRQIKNSKIQRAILIESIIGFLDDTNRITKLEKLAKNKKNPILMTYKLPEVLVYENFELNYNNNVYIQKNRSKKVIKNRIWSLKSSEYELKIENQNNDIYLDIGMTEKEYFKKPTIYLNYYNGKEKIKSKVIKQDDLSVIHRAMLSKLKLIEIEKFGELEEIDFQTIKLECIDENWNKILIESSDDIYIDNILIKNKK